MVEPPPLRLRRLLDVRRPRRLAWLGLGLLALLALQLLLLRLRLLLLLLLAAVAVVPLTLGRDLALAESLVAIARRAVFRTPRVHGPAVFISSGNAHEFLAFLRLAQLPDPAKGLVLWLMESVFVHIRQRLAHTLVISPAA